MITIAGLYLKAKNPWNQTQAELNRSVNFLKKKKHLAKLNWSSETELWQAFGAGDVWIAYAWPNDWVQMKKKQLRSSTCTRRRSRSRGSACSCSSRARRDPTSRTRTSTPGARRRRASGSRTTTATGTRTSRRGRRRAQLLKALQLTNPKAVTLPNAYLDRDIPQRATYAHLWEQVKAA